jgi:hypothetical protein
MTTSTSQYPWFSKETCDRAFDLWIRTRGVVSYPRFRKALALCFHPDYYPNGDEYNLRVLEWALAQADGRPVTPEIIAADWAQARKLMAMDPWDRAAAVFTKRGR